MSDFGTSKKQIRKSNRMRTAIGLAAFILPAAILVAIIATLASMRAGMRSEIALQKANRDKVQSETHQIRDDALQLQKDRAKILDVLKQCRAADDVPALGGQRIAAAHRGLEHVVLYVPEGSHTLEISTAWQEDRPAASNKADQEAHESDSPSTGDHTWQFPLQPSSGYLLKTKSDRSKHSILWQLTGSHPEFEAKQATLPLEEFRHVGSSWSGSGIVTFPNPVLNPRSLLLSNSSVATAGVTICQGTMTGLVGEVSYKVTITIKVLTDGPPNISASAAQRAMKSGLESHLLRYCGDGRYEIHMDEVEID